MRVLLPIGTFPASAPPLSQLANIVHAFFTLHVKTLPAVNVREVKATTRLNQDTDKRQLLAPEVLAWLKTHLPDDAFGLVAAAREGALATVFDTLGIDDEAAWSAARARFIRTAAPPVQ